MTDGWRHCSSQTNLYTETADVTAPVTPTYTEINDITAAVTQTYTDTGDVTAPVPQTCVFYQYSYCISRLIP